MAKNEGGTDKKDYLEQKNQPNTEQTPVPPEAVTAADLIVKRIRREAEISTVPDDHALPDVSKLPIPVQIPQPAMVSTPIPGIPEYQKTPSRIPENEQKFIDTMVKITNKPELVFDNNRFESDEQTKYVRKMNNGEYFEEELSGGENGETTISKYFDFKSGDRKLKKSDFTLTKAKERICRFLPIKEMLSPDIFKELHSTLVTKMGDKELGQEKFEEIMNEFIILVDKLLAFSAEFEVKYGHLEPFHPRRDNAKRELMGKFAGLRKDFISKYPSLGYTQIGYKMFDNFFLRLTPFLQNANWFPEEPGGEEGNIVRIIPSILHEVVAQRLIDRGIIEDQGDVVFFNSGSTPIDYLSKTDSYFAVVKGPFKGLILGIDYTIRDKNKQCWLGANLHIDRVKFMENIPSQEYKRHRRSYRRASQHGEILKKIRERGVKEVFEPAIQKTISGLDQKLDEAITAKRAGQTTSMFVEGIDKIYIEIERRRNESELAAA